LPVTTCTPHCYRHCFVLSSPLRKGSLCSIHRPRGPCLHATAITATAIHDSAAVRGATIPHRANTTMSASPARGGPSRRAPNHPQQTRTRTRGPGSGTATPEGSATQTITSAPPQPDGLVLHLRGAHQVETQTRSRSESEEPQPSTRRRIQWAEDVVDNEGLGRKKSKVCCIFHKTREVGESSSEDDSSSSDDSEAGSSPSDDGGARPVGGKRRGRGKRRHGPGHEHEHGDGCGHGAERKPSPNAYEKMPKYDVKPLERQPGT